MKETLKFILILTSIFLAIIILDSLYAVIFDTSPIIKIRENVYIR